MTNSADPDQLASSEANWSGSTVFAKTGHVMFSKSRVKLQFKWLLMVVSAHLCYVSISNIDKHFYAPTYLKNSGWALSITPVRPVRPSVRLSIRLSVRQSRLSIHPYVPLFVRAIIPKLYGIYSWNFTGAYITLRRCVMNKEDNSCIFGFWIISAWLSSIQLTVSGP